MPIYIHCSISINSIFNPVHFPPLKPSTTKNTLIKLLTMNYAAHSHREATGYHHLCEHPKGSAGQHHQHSLLTHLWALPLPLPLSPSNSPPPPSPPRRPPQGPFRITIPHPYDEDRHHLGYNCRVIPEGPPQRGPTPRTPPAPSFHPGPQRRRRSPRRREPSSAPPQPREQ